MPLSPISGKLSSLRIFNGLLPESEGRSISRTYDFFAASSYIEDLVAAEENNLLEFIQTVFIDNSNNGSAVNLNITVSGQVITCPPYSQGYFPVCAPNPQKITVSSSGTAVVGVQYLNIPLPANVWSVV